MKRRLFLNSSLAATFLTVAGPNFSMASVFDDNKVISTNPNYLRRGNMKKDFFRHNEKDRTRTSPTLPWSYNIIKDPTSTAPTKYVERFELRDRDYWTVGWDGDAADKHRVEIMGDAVRYGDEHFYEWNIYIEDNFLQGMDDESTCGPNIYEPVGNNGQTVVQFHIRGYRPSVYRMTTTLYNGKKRKVYRIAEYSDIVNRWVNIKWQVKWHHTEGYHRIWVDGKEKVSVSGYTLGKNSDTANIKYGMYRNGVKKWEGLNPGKKTPTKYILYSGVSRSDVR